MNILEQHQVVCTMELWHQKIFMGHFKEWGVYMVLPKKMELSIALSIRNQF